MHLHILTLKNLTLPLSLELYSGNIFESGAHENGSVIGLSGPLFLSERPSLHALFENYHTLHLPILVVTVTNLFFIR
jgi:hypothetical protein